MKSTLLYAASALALLTAACKSAEHERPRGFGQMWVSETLRAAAIQEAVNTQRTLFPYHFVAGGAELNELGMHDLELLASHLAATGADLRVPRGSAPEELHRARVRSVGEALAELGLAQVPIVEGVPGGDGVPSARMLEILDADSPQIGGQLTTSHSASAAQQ